LLPLVFLTIPLLQAAIGMETFLALMLAMACLTFYSLDKLPAAALACSLAVLARPDMILLAALLVGYHIIRTRRLPAIRVMVIFLLPLLAWTLFSLIYFGQALPTSMDGKLAQTEAGLWGSGPVFFKELRATLLPDDFAGPRLVVVAAVLCGLVLLVVKLRRWSLFRHPTFHMILLWTLLYLLAYGVLFDAPGYRWYYTPLALAIALLATLPLEGLYRLLAGKPRARDRLFLPAVYLVLVLIGLSGPVRAPTSPEKQKQYTYRQAAEWLNDNAPPGASVGAGDIGVLGYYYENGPVIDAAGLVTPGVIEHLRAKDTTWYVHHYQPDYLMFSHPPRRHVEAELAREEWFRQLYYVEKIVISPTMRVALYQRVES
jgi:hypothetical protein